jgi:hypothetical protein
MYPKEEDSVTEKNPEGSDEAKANEEPIAQYELEYWI